MHLNRLAKLVYFRHFSIESRHDLCSGHANPRKNPIKQSSCNILFRCLIRRSGKCRFIIDSEITQKGSCNLPCLHIYNRIHIPFPYKRLVKYLILYHDIHRGLGKRSLGYLYNNCSRIVRDKLESDSGNNSPQLRPRLPDPSLVALHRVDC